MSKNNDIVKGDQQNAGQTRRRFLKNLTMGTGAALGYSFLKQNQADAVTNDPRPKSVQSGKFVFYNFEMFHPSHTSLLKDLVILVEGDKIKALERLGDLSGYGDFQPFDLDGMTLLPGFIDAHVHITVPFMYTVNLDTILQMDEQIELNFQNCLLGGVTTVRDMGGFPGHITKFSRLVEENKILGPRVISSLSPIAARNGKTFGAPERAPYFSNPVLKWFLGGNFAERPETPEEIDAVCENMIQQGAQWLKTMYQEHPFSYITRRLPNHSDEGYARILAKGRKHNLPCAIHAPFTAGFKKGVDLGFHTLEHMPMDGLIPDDHIDAFINRDMAIIPTMLVYHDRQITKRLQQLVKNKGNQLFTKEAEEQTSSLLTKLLKNQKKTPRYILDKLPNMKSNLKRLFHRGATIGLGTDAGGGIGTFFGRYADELHHYSDAGIPAHDILCRATAVNAKILGMEDRIGTLEKGKCADMIAVRGNPLKDLNVLNSVAMVVKAGHIINIS